MAIVARFINKKLKGKFFKKLKPNFRMFAVSDADIGVKEADQKKSLAELVIDDVDQFAGLSFGAKKTGLNFKGKFYVNLSVEDTSMALNYFFRKGSEEVKMFNKPDLLKKISIEKDVVLYCKSRILDGQRFVEAGGLENSDIIKEMN